MKAARFFPLAFIANVHGFLLLAPYLVVFLTVVRVIQVWENQKLETRSSTFESNSKGDIQIAVPSAVLEL